MPQLENIHVVLIEPEDNLNIGSVARAMMNLGFSNLHLVAPPKYRPAKAAVTACWAKEILERTVVHEKLEQALSSMQEVVGFTARAGKNRTGLLNLEQYAANLQQCSARSIALLFGPEDSGLRQDHLQHCRYLVRIPSSEECPAFNLAQAVLLALYQIQRSISAEAPSQVAESDASEWSQFYQLDRLLDSVLKESGFINSGTPAQLPGLIKSLFRRTNPTAREMQILLGVFDRIDAGLRRAEKCNALSNEAPEATSKLLT